jgi:HD-GYP domain-containing protein (c-di-GMP phosphodiesterase class II)
MLTQMIAKDASRLYTLVQSVETGNIAGTPDVVKAKIKTTRESLKTAEIEFDKTLEAMNSGYIESDGDHADFKNSLQKSVSELKEIDNIWICFKASIERIADTSSINTDTENALMYIDSNNKILLKDCDLIIQNVVKDAKENSAKSRNISIAMLVFSLIIIIYFFFRLYKYILGPFNELFNGISRIGLNNGFDISVLPTKKELVPVVSEIGSMFKKIEMLISLIENMNKNTSFNEILKFIYDAFLPFIPYSYIGIALIKENGKMIEASYGISDGSIHGLPQNLIGKKYCINDTSLESIMYSANARVINDLEKYTDNKSVKDYNKYIMDAGVRASITLPLIINSEPVGIIFFSSRYKNIYTEEHVKFLETLVDSIAISLEKSIFADELLFGSLLAMVKLAEARDEETGDHLERMKVYSRTITESLLSESKYVKSITPEYIENIERFSPMHDIGKVGIRDGILLKPGKLTTDEFDEMKKHAIYGADVLRTAESNITKKGRNIFQMGIEIAEGHHEKWDGSGYPYGKRGEEIPLSARIVAIADVFDALSSKRPYKEAFSFEESFDTILEGSGKHFDPEIVRAFELNKKRIFEIYNMFNEKPLVA